MFENLLIPGGIAIASGLIIIALLGFIGVYVYMALAWSTIAKRLKYKNGWIAWIPLVQFALLPILAEKDWPWVFIFLIPVVGIVFSFIWMWRIVERRKFPSWTILLTLIPSGGSLWGLVLLGILAWKKD